MHTRIDIAIWEEFQRQPEARDLTLKRSVIQNATFITADLGHVSADTPPGRPGTDAVKLRWHLGGNGSEVAVRVQTPYLLDKDSQLIRRMAITTASLHDSKIDLSWKGETVYRNKGYFGVKSWISMD